MSGLLPRTPPTSGVGASGVYGFLTVGSLIVNNIAAIRNLMVSGSASFASVVGAMGGVAADVYSNFTAGSTVTLRTTGGSANVLLSPNGTGSVVVRAGNAILADAIGPSTASGTIMVAATQRNAQPGTSNVASFPVGAGYGLNKNPGTATDGLEISVGAGSTPAAAFGANSVEPSPAAYAYGHAGYDLKLGSNDTEQLRIAKTGIPNVAAPDTLLTMSAAFGTQLNQTSVAGGLYTPTWTTTALFTAAPTSQTLIWMRVGNIVWCQYDAENVGIATGINVATITIPVAFPAPPPTSPVYGSGQGGSKIYGTNTTANLAYITSTTSTTTMTIMTGTASSYTAFLHLGFMYYTGP